MNILGFEIEVDTIPGVGLGVGFQKFLGRYELGVLVGWFGVTIRRKAR